jgi:hypothetical protein
MIHSLAKFNGPFTEAEDWKRMGLSNRMCTILSCLVPKNSFHMETERIPYCFFRGVGLSPLRTAATSGLLYKPQMIDDGECRAIGEMKIGRRNRSTRRKPAPAPLCPPQIPHDQTREPTNLIIPTKPINPNKPTYQLTTCPTNKTHSANTTQSTTTSTKENPTKSVPLN